MYKRYVIYIWVKGLDSCAILIAFNLLARGNRVAC